jgi:hypothetical protein
MSFLGDFARYLRTRTDCPPDFHYHAGLVALATALGNRVCCHGWTRPIYPNLWSVVIAPSGYGKSAPLDMCERIVAKAGLVDLVLPGSFSQEALYGVLKDKPVGTFVLQEFSAFLGMLSKEYNAGCTQFLTEIYDCPESVRRLTYKHGEFLILRPCVSILGASSPSWFADSFKTKDLSGGFLARFMFCPSVEAGPAIGSPGPPDDASEAGLADHLRQAATLGSPARPLYADLSAVEGIFDTWDRDERKKLRADPDPLFSGMRSRSGVMVRKAAMLFAVSRDAKRLVVTKGDLDHAINFVDHSHSLAEKFLTEEVAQDADEADRIKIIDILRRHDGRLPWWEMLKLSRMRADKCRRAVDTLVQAGRLELLKAKGQGSREQQWVCLVGHPVPLASLVSREISRNGETPAREVS